MKKIDVSKDIEKIVVQLQATIRDKQDVPKKEVQLYTDWILGKPVINGWKWLNPLFNRFIVPKLTQFIQTVLHNSMEMQTYFNRMIAYESDNTKFKISELENKLDKIDLALQQLSLHNSSYLNMVNNYSKFDKKLAYFEDKSDNWWNEYPWSAMVNWRINYAKQMKLYEHGNFDVIAEVGTGHFPFSSLVPGYKKAIGYEPHEPFRLRAVENVASDKRWTMTDKDFFSVPDGEYESLDAIFSYQVYEHIPKEMDYIGTCKKRLKPGGWCVVEVPNVLLTPVFIKANGYVPDGGGEYPGSDHINEPDPISLFKEFRENGFEIWDINSFYFPIDLWRGSIAQKYPEIAELAHSVGVANLFYSYIFVMVARKKSGI